MAKSLSNDPTTAVEDWLEAHKAPGGKQTIIEVDNNSEKTKRTVTLEKLDLLPEDVQDALIDALNEAIIAKLDELGISDVT
jgi:hypothetical protein